MDIDEETASEYREDKKFYLQEEVMTPNGEGKVCAFGLHQKEVKVWVEDDNQYEWFDKEEIYKI